MEGCPLSLNPLLLRFADPKLERRYRDDRLNFRLNSFRVSAISGAAMWLLFTLLNSFTIQDPSQPLFYVRLSGMVGLLLLYAASFAVRPGRRIEAAGVAALAVNIGLLTLVLVFMSPISLPYYPLSDVYQVLAVVSFVLCCVSFVEGVVLAAGTICFFFFAVTVLWPEPGLLVLYHFAWVFSLIVLVGVGSYILDCVSAPNIDAFRRPTLGLTQSR
jgi:hypothetical protein